MEPEQLITSQITKTTYKLRKNIGQGTFAQCWSAVDMTNNTDVCLKLVDYWMMEEQQQKEAEREAQIHVSLLCP